MVQRPESPRQKSWINPQVLLVFLAFVFLTIIIWLNELIDVPHLLLGAQETPFNWHEAIFETFLLVLIGAVSLYLLSRSVKQHKLAREDIFREKSFSHILLQSSPSFFVAIDTEGKTTMVNDEFLREIGYTREELIGRDFLTTLVPASEHVALAPFFRALARKGMVSVIENHVVAKDGRKLLVEWRGRPVFKENGELDFLFGVGTDITERKKIEKELRKSRERMRTLHKQAQDLRERERARVAREIHDELGQVLTALKIDLSLIKKKLPPEQTSLNTKLAGMIRSLETTIETVRRIITDLRPGLLDHLGLFAAIEWQARDFEKRTGITCTLFIEPEEIMLDPESTISLFRIFQ
ncbi:MAG: PAS domain S-box protein, partial [Desulfomonilia bacterium]|nr:PAS domain S-box protein [Desulfomonilia bacterium]